MCKATGLGEEMQDVCTRMIVWGHRHVVDVRGVCGSLKFQICSS